VLLDRPPHLACTLSLQCKAKLLQRPVPFVMGGFARVSLMRRVLAKNPSSVFRAWSSPFAIEPSTVGGIEIRNELHPRGGRAARKRAALHQCSFITRNQNLAPLL
jgi:hypothetical protein